jgi:Flp pilus assembly protein TadG
MFLMLWIGSLRSCPLSGRLTALLRPSLTWISALTHDRRGVSAVEFGLAAPVFLAALSPLIDLGLAFSQQIRVNQAVEAGAQYAAVNQYNSDTWATNVQNAVTNATTLTVSPIVGSETCRCPNATNTAIVTHDTATTCGTANGGTACSDGTEPGYYITISATATYTSVMPYPIINNPTLSSQAIVRIQ